MHFDKAVFFVVAAATAAQAEESPEKKYSAEIGISSLGFFAAPAYAVSENVSIRAPLYLAKMNYGHNFEGNDVDFDLSVTSFSFVADYYPGGSSFRVSGGFATSGYELNSTVLDPTLNDNAYSGKFDLDLAQEQQVAPVLSLGLNKPIGDNWGFVSELGVRVANLKLDARAPASLSPAERAQLDADVDTINDDLASIPLIPFLSLGASLRF